MFDLIVNPNAKFAAKCLPEVEERLKAAGAEYTVFRGTSKEETRAYVSALTKEAGHTVVAAGGDGTLCDVLTGISDVEGTTLGLIALGTGNDFAAAANIPEGAAGVDLLLNGTPQYTDFIELDGGLRSMNVAGLGIDVDILERCYRMKRGGAKSKYFRGLLASIFKYKGQRIEVTADGEKFDSNAIIAAVCNGTQFGGGIRICPPANVYDGKLDLVIAAYPKRIKILHYLLKLMKGRILELPITRHILCESVHIVQVGGTYMQLDGELVASHSLSAHIVHGKLRMYRG